MDPETKETTYVSKGYEIFQRLGESSLQFWSCSSLCLSSAAPMGFSTLQLILSPEV